MPGEENLTTLMWYPSLFNPPNMFDETVPSLGGNRREGFSPSVELHKPLPARKILIERQIDDFIRDIDHLNGWSSLGREKL